MIIAEIGHNWNCDLMTAEKMINQAALAGADVVKFQLYNTDYIKSPHESNYKELKAAELSKNDLLFLYRAAKYAEIEFLVSIFDSERFDWLEELGIKLKRHKIASRTIRDMKLLDKVIASGLPIIASLGEWNEEQPPSYFPKERTNFLLCQSRRSILQEGFKGLPQKFKIPITGFSDHTIGNEWALNAIDRGARIIEKHFTLNRNWAGWDQPASGTVEDFIKIVRHYRRVSGRT